MWGTHIHLRTPFQTAKGFTLFFPGYFSFHTPDVPTPQGVTAQPRHVQRHRHSALGVEREGSPSYRDVDCCGCEDVVFCCLSRFMLKMLFSYVFMLFSYSWLSSRSMCRCCLFLFIARFWCWCKVNIFWRIHGSELGTHQHLFMNSDPHIYIIPCDIHMCRILSVQSTNHMLMNLRNKTRCRTIYPCYLNWWI